MRTVADYYAPDKKLVCFESDKEAISRAADEIERLQRVVMAQLRYLKDANPDYANEEPAKRHVQEASEIVRGLRIRAKN